MSSSFDFETPAQVALGSVGPPGHRVFYLQARQGDRLMSLKLEKQQVAFLAGGLSEVLADLASPGAPPGTASIALEEPVEADWSVGSLELAYDSTADRIVVVAAEVGTPDEDDADDEEEESPGSPPRTGSAPAPPGAVGRVAITREQAAAMVEHGKVLLRAGRPPCPLCGYPLTDDHSCPKTNGHRPPSL